MSNQQDDTLTDEEMVKVLGRKLSDLIDAGVEVSTTMCPDGLLDSIDVSDRGRKAGTWFVCEDRDDPLLYRENKGFANSRDDAPPNF